jgi:hypothetical protein
MSPARRPHQAAATLVTGALRCGSQYCLPVLALAARDECCAEPFDLGRNTTPDPWHPSASGDLLTSRPCRVLGRPALRIYPRPARLVPGAPHPATRSSTRPRPACLIHRCSRACRAAVLCRNQSRLRQAHQRAVSLHLPQPCPGCHCSRGMPRPRPRMLAHGRRRADKQAVRQSRTPWQANGWGFVTSAASPPIPADPR